MQLKFRSFATNLREARAYRACSRQPVRMAAGFGPTIVQNPSSGKNNTATLIFLHGLGDTGNGIASIGQALVTAAPALSHIKFIFPTAPRRPVAMNGGMTMPAWFDIDFSKGGRVDTEGISSSVQYLDQLVAEEIKAGTPADRIAIGGFSQGGHVSLNYLPTARVAPAGCIALSTWLVPDPNLQVADANKQVPVFVGHGTADPLIPLALASTTQAFLQQKGFKNVQFKTYQGMPHSTCPEELADIRAYLTSILPDKMPTSKEVDRMSVKDLKAFLASRSVSTRSALEKSDLVKLAKAAL